jgi:hypothetical protein
LTNGTLKQDVQDEQNYLASLREFNEANRKQTFETKSVILKIKEDIKTLKQSLINESVSSLLLAI